MRKTEPSTIEWEGLQLPEYLFTIPESRSETPPTATFSPVHYASSGGNSAWTSSTSPSKKPRKKDILLTSESFLYVNKQRRLAFVGYLQALGFNVYVKTGPKTIKAVPIPNSPESMEEALDIVENASLPDNRDNQMLYEQFDCDSDHTLKVTHEQACELIRIFRADYERGAASSLPVRKKQFVGGFLCRDLQIGDSALASKISLLKDCLRSAAMVGDLDAYDKFRAKIRATLLDNGEVEESDFKDTEQQELYYVLVELINNNQHDKVSDLLKNHYPPPDDAKEFLSLYQDFLILAIGQSSPEMVEVFVEYGFDPSYEAVSYFSKGEPLDAKVSLLYSALKHHNTELVNYLAEKHPQLIDAAVLEYAIENSQMGVIKAVLKKENHLTHLIDNKIAELAAQYGVTEILEYVIAEKPELVTVDEKSLVEFENMVIDLAKKGQFGILDKIGELSDDNANAIEKILIDNTTHIFLKVIEGGYTEVAKRILDAVEKPIGLIKQENDNKWNALDCAVRWGHTETVKLLLKTISESTPEDKKTLLKHKTSLGQTIFHMSAMAENDDGEMFELLREELSKTLSPEEIKELITAQSIDGQNLVHYAITHNKPKLLAKLIYTYPEMLDVKVAANYQRSLLLDPLQFAATRHRAGKECAELLLAAGLDETSPVEDTNAQGASPFTKYIEEGKASGKTQNSGLNAVLLACKEDNLELLEVFLTKNPELLFCKDSEGRSVLDYAAENLSVNVLNFLIDNHPELFELDEDGESLHAKLPPLFTLLHIAPANINKSDEKKQKTSHLHRSRYGCSYEDSKVKLVQRLVERFPEQIEPTPGNVNAIHVAAYHLDSRSLRVLLEARPDLAFTEAKDFENKAPALLALESEDWKHSPDSKERAAEILRLIWDTLSSHEKQEMPYADFVKKIQAEVADVAEQTTHDSVDDEEEKNPKKLFLAGDGFDPNPNGGVQTNPSYNMSETGEVLNNPASIPRMRTRVFQYLDITKSFTRLEYEPTLDKQDLPDAWSDDKVLQCKTPMVSNRVFSQLSRQLQPNTPTRLISMAIDDEIIVQAKAVDSFGRPVAYEFFRGDDGFYYVQADVECTFTYLMDSPLEEATLKQYRGIKSDSEDEGLVWLKNIIDAYNAKSEGKPKAKQVDVDKELPDAKTQHAKYCKFLYENSTKYGSCLDRTWAILYKVAVERPDLEDRIRQVRIDNSHVRIEICSHDGKWMAVPDLGGIPAALNYEKKQATKAERKKRLSLVESEHGGTSTQVAQLEETTPAPLFKPIEEASALTEAVLSSPQKRVLVTSDGQLDELTNALVKEAVASGRPVFVVDKADDLDIGRDTVVYLPDGTITIAPRGQLDVFLDSIKPEKQPLLIVRADNFSPQEKVRFNEIQDRRAIIKGRTVPDSMQIVTLERPISAEEQVSRGAFISRHGLKIESKVKVWPKVRPEVNVAETQVTEVDFQGFPDWRSQLFGHVVVRDNQIYWDKSDFVKTLEKGASVNFSFINMPPESKAEIEAEIDRAYAMGAFYYLGKKIPLNTESCHISTQHDVGFDFAQFANASIQTGVMLKDAPADVKIINSYNFDRLLHDKKIEGGIYNNAEGLIEAAANQTLKLYISDTLSDSQWYCMFKLAQTHNVKLDIRTILKETDLPKGMNKGLINSAEEREEVAAAERTIPPIVVTNSAKEELKDDKYKNKRILHVEDYTSMDMLHGTPDSVEFDAENKRFREFKMLSSALELAHKDGQEVVLAGTFSDELLSYLYPLFEDSMQGISLVIEDPKTAIGKPYAGLPMLSLDEYSISMHQITKEPERVATYTETESNTPLEVFLTQHENDAERKQECDLFEEKRIEQLSSKLEESACVKLVGAAAVGKSQLLKLYGEKDGVKVYSGLDAIADWAEGEVDGEVQQRVLFLDEANITDKHYTMLSPLLERNTVLERNTGQPTVLFHRGKWLTIPASCKVVFAMNPPVDKQGRKYAGGRVEPKFLNENDFPTIELEALPESYIYQRVLKEKLFDPFYASLTKEQKVDVTEQIFEEKAVEYFQQHRTTGKEIEPRAAQREMLRFLAEKAFGRTYPKKAASIKDGAFISTTVTDEVQRSLQEVLFLSLKQFEGSLPQDAIGTPGMLLDGPPGMGKSEMVRAVIGHSGLKQAFTATELEMATSQRYIKVSAGLSLAQKTEIITAAYKYGHVIWIDELNSCLDDGLEKVLNAVMTGENPKTGAKDAVRGGMRIIATTNPGFHKGRTSVGTALKSRFNVREMPLFSAYDDDSLRKILVHLLSISTGIEESSKPDISVLLNEIKTNRKILNIRDVASYLVQTYGISFNTGESRQLDALKYAHRRMVNKRGLEPGGLAYDGEITSAYNAFHALIKIGISDVLFNQLLQQFYTSDNHRAKGYSRDTAFLEAVRQATNSLKPAPPNTPTEELIQAGLLSIHGDMPERTVEISEEAYLELVYLERMGKAERSDIKWSDHKLSNTIPEEANSDLRSSTFMLYRNFTADFIKKDASFTQPFNAQGTALNLKLHTQFMALSNKEGDLTQKLEQFQRGIMWCYATCETSQDLLSIAHGELGAGTEFDDKKQRIIECQNQLLTFFADFDVPNSIAIKLIHSFKSVQTDSDLKLMSKIATALNTLMNLDESMIQSHNEDDAKKEIGETWRTIVDLLLSDDEEHIKQGLACTEKFSTLNAQETTDFSERLKEVLKGVELDGKQNILDSEVNFLPHRVGTTKQVAF